ncbi:transforming growth factor-beta-induced protein ig-h3-like [Saccostrea echinata]|uniref:transforming growth factor-beta-induced protein ig-h3-like n=1 Tax=Saccostrea echinata TaxID=191078 RepID=UPI002A7EEF2C|nr:transforming growth factor-beta-induced protein ig-h3-like [Saccostrea echinata]
MSRFCFLLCFVLLLLVADDIESRRHRRHRSRFGRRLSDGLRGLRSQIRRWNHRWRLPWADINFAFNYGSGGSRDWWDGPNVCTEEERKNETTSDDISSHHMATTVMCDDKKTSYICTKSMTINGKKTTLREVKECCHGYSRISGQYGCPTYRQLHDIVKTAESMNLTEFLRVARSVGLESKLYESSGANFTVFAPTNDALKQTPTLSPTYENVILSDMNSVIRISPPVSTLLVSDASDLVLGHVTGGILTTTRLEDEQTITSANSKSSTIRVNFYDMVNDGIMTANCKRVTSRDNLATNGVIHVVEDVLQPVTKSLMDIVSSNPQLSYLKKAIGRSGLGVNLRGDGQFTLFAPTDNAFQKLDGGLLQRILSDQRCLKKILFHHLLPNVICSSAVSDKHKSRTKNQLSNYLRLSRDQNNKYFVENAQIVDRDVMATNGVLHLIDDVILPDEALGVLHALQKRNITRLPELVVEAGLKKSFETADNITVLVPTDEAFSKMTEFAAKRLNESETALADALRYHVIPTTSTCRAYDGYQFPTWNPRRNLTVHRDFLFPFHGYNRETIQCATILKSNIQSCNAVIHLIDKVLVPPVGTVVDVLEVDSRFTEFVRLLKNSGLADQLQGKGPYTVLAPTNEALKEVSENDLKELESRKENLQSLIKDHIIKGHRCCSQIQRYSDRFSIFTRNLRSVSGMTIAVEKSRDQLTVGSASVVECDMVGTNGVVHAINQVLQEEDYYDPFDFW